MWHAIGAGARRHGTLARVQTVAPKKVVPAPQSVPRLQLPHLVHAHAHFRDHGCCHERCQNHGHGCCREHE